MKLKRKIIYCLLAIIVGGCSVEWYLFARYKYVVFSVEGSEYYYMVSEKGEDMYLGMSKDLKKLKRKALPSDDINYVHFINPNPTCINNEVMWERHKPDTVFCIHCGADRNSLDVSFQNLKVTDPKQCSMHMKLNNSTLPDCDDVVGIWLGSHKKIIVRLIHIPKYKVIKGIAYEF